MPSNLYLFDPAQAQSNAGEKPLIQLVRDAEIAKTAAEPATKLARTPANEDRLAA